MPNFAPTMPTTLVDTLHEMVCERALLSARVIHAGATTARATILKNDDNVTPALLREREATAVGVALAQFDDRVGSIVQHEQGLTLANDLLDLDTIIADARMLPPIVDGNSHEADLRRIADAAETARYQAKLFRLKGNVRSEAARIVAEAGSAAHESAALCKLGRLADYVGTLTGKERSEGMAALADARVKIEANWTELNRLRGRAQAVEQGLNELRTRRDAIYGIHGAQEQTKYFDWEAKRAALKVA